MDLLVSVLMRVTGMLPFFALAAAMLVLGKLFFERTVSYKFHEQLTDHDNPAFGVCFAGFLIGLGIALAGSLHGIAILPDNLLAASQAGVSDNRLWLLLERLFAAAVAGIASILLMRLSMVINAKLILHRFCIDKEMIQDRNVGTGIVVAGTNVATGLMLSGALTGVSLPLMPETLPAWLGGTLGSLRDVCIYWAMGQAILVVAALVFQWIARYDVQKVISEQDNVPVGIAFCGYLVALGIITRAALVGAGSDILAEMAITGVLAACGVVLLVMVNIVAEWALFSRTARVKELVTDRNCAAGVVEGACFIGVAILLAAAISHGS